MFIIACSSGAGRSSRCYDVYRRDAVLRKTVTWLMEEYVYEIFHLSDLHIGLKLMNHDMREDQEYILSEVIEVAGREKPDAIVIAGDIYDKAVPSAEAVEVLTVFWSDSPKQCRMRLL